MVPYRLTIELATPGAKGKTVTVTGATPDRRAGAGEPNDVECSQMAAEVLACQAEALKLAGRSARDFEQVDALMNMAPVGGVN